MSHPLPHDWSLLLIVQLAVVLVVARALGELCRRAGMPTLVGELTAGVLLGPQVLGALAPHTFNWLIVPAQGTLHIVAGVSAVLLVLLNGTDIRINLISERFRKMFWICLGGLAIPFFSGIWLGSVSLGVETPASFALFLGIALSISGVSTLKRILSHLNVLGRDIGQTMLAAGMLQNLVGWILLAAWIATATTGPVVWSFVLAGSFVVLALMLGRILLDWTLDFVDECNLGVRGQLAAILAMTVLAAVASRAFGLDSLLGALAVGILVAQSGLLHDGTRKMLRVGVGNCCAPFFFAAAGMQVDLRVLGETSLSLVMVFVVAAWLAKGLGVWWGARRSGMSRWESLALGLGLNARGFTEVIAATVGLTTGVLSVGSYSLFLLMVMLTTVLAALTLRVVLKRMPPSLTEVKPSEFVRGLHRVLLPLGKGPHSAGAAALIGHLADEQDLEVTVLPFNPDAQVLSQLKDDLWTPPRIKQAPVEDESARGYQLMMVGAAAGQGALLSPAVDQILRSSQCPVALVRVPGAQTLDRPQRILVASSGSRSSMAAVEMAAAISCGAGAHLTLAHVGESKRGALLERQAAAARTMGASVSTRVLPGAQPEASILELTQLDRYDLLVLHAHIRNNGGRAYLGAQAERLLAGSGVPVLVLAFPQQRMRDLLSA